MPLILKSAETHWKNLSAKLEENKGDLHDHIYWENFTVIAAKKTNWQEYVLEDQLENKCYETGRNDLKKKIWLVTRVVQYWEKH